MSKLRKKMIQIVMISVVFVFAICVAGVFTYSYINCVYDADKITKMIEDNQGVMPKYDDFKPQKRLEDNWIGTFEFNEEAEFTTRYFVVFLDKNGTETRMSLDNVAAIHPSEATAMSQEALAKSGDTGFVDGYRFRKCGDLDSRYIIFLDCKTSLTQVYAITFIVISVSLILIIAISVVFVFASKKAIRPFVENAQRQRQFITDAGHELKTPLAVISANAEVLDYKSPENKEWTAKIKAEVKNMNKLIAQLLFLSKSEEIDNKIEYDEVDFSSIVLDKVKEYSDVFAAKDVSVNKDAVSKNIKSQANFDGINRLISILFDNCGKYVKEGGEVVVVLKRAPLHIRFDISNTDSNDGPIDCERLFDRFYRSDSSRNSKTGGHGIGLSIAKRICLQHKGTITCEQKDGMVTFSVSIPTNLK